MRDCTIANPSDRPSIATVVDSLSSILAIIQGSFLIFFVSFSDLLCFFVVSFSVLFRLVYFSFIALSILKSMCRLQMQET